MKTLTEFKESLNFEKPASGLSIQLKSLWYDARGDWHKAHAQVDQLSDKGSALVHAYLHRKKAIFGMLITGIVKRDKHVRTYLSIKNGSS